MYMFMYMYLTMCTGTVKPVYMTLYNKATLYIEATAQVPHHSLLTVRLYTKGP